MDSSNTPSGSLLDPGELKSILAVFAEKLDSINKTLDSISVKIDSNDNKIINLELKIKDIENNIIRHQEEISVLKENSVENKKWLRGIASSIAVALIIGLLNLMGLKI